MKQYKHRGRKWEDCQEVGAAIRPFALALDIEESPLLAYLRFSWFHISCCEYMVEYYIASNSEATVAPLLRRRWVAKICCEVEHSRSALRYELFSHKCTVFI